MNFDDKEQKWQLKIMGQSARLAELLTPDITDSEGVQQSIIMYELENDVQSPAMA